jgi:hypothetical protein
MDRDTVINTLDNDDDSPEELMVNLTKDRRSGMDRRAGPSANSLARLDIEREYRAELRALQERENQKDLEISELKSELARLEQWQKDNDEVLKGAKVIVNAGMALKVTIYFFIGIMAAVGGVFGTMQAVKEWFHQ